MEVWLSKGQLGYLGLEQITYRAWASVLEQTATGDIVVQTDDKEVSNNEQSTGGAFTIGLHKGLAEAKAVAKVRYYFNFYQPSTFRKSYCPKQFLTNCFNRWTFRH